MVRELLSEYPYLSMLMKIWSGDCKNKLERMNTKVDKYTGKDVIMVNRQACKVRRFSSNEFWKKIGCLVLAPNFGLRGSRLCEK